MGECIKVQPRASVRARRATELKAILGVGETVGEGCDVGECEMHEAFDAIRLAGKSGQQHFRTLRTEGTVGQSGDCDLPAAAIAALEAQHYRDADHRIAGSRVPELAV